jgi:di/tripeptidase
MKHLLLSVFIGLSSVSAATKDNSILPLNEEKLSIFEVGLSLLQQDQYEASSSIFQSLTQDTQVQQRKHMLFVALFNLATNYECMFIRELGAVKQQRENINKAIEYFEQIIREIGVLPGYEYTVEKTTPRLKEAQQQKAEFVLRHAASN